MGCVGAAWLLPQCVGDAWRWSPSPFSANADDDDGDEALADVGVDAVDS